MPKEFEQIMSEIEGLQEDMVNIASSKLEELDSEEGKQTEASMPVAEVPSHEASPGSSPGPVEDSTNVKQRDREAAWLEEETFANLKHSDQPASVTMNLDGNLTVRLRHERTGQEVSISFSNDSIGVHLEDGAEIRIPVKSKTPLRRVV